MSTKFSTDQLLSYAVKARITTPAHAQVMKNWANVDPQTLVTQPQALAQCLAAQKALEHLGQHPAVQAAIVPAEAPHASIDQQNLQQANIARATIRDVLGHPEPPVQRSVTYGQQAAPVQKGYVTYDATPGYRQPQVQPDLTIKAEVERIQAALDQVVKNFAAALQQAGPPTQKSALYRKVGLSPRGNRVFEPITSEDPARPGEQVFRKKSKGKFEMVGKAATVQKAAVQAPAPYQLPVSPVTGEPSSITAAVRATTMGEPNPTANLHPVHTEALRQQQAFQQQANYKNGLPVSPITGKPSQITATIRKSTL